MNQDNQVFQSMIAQGYGLLQEGRFEEAIESFSASHALEAGDDRPLRGRALAHIRLGNGEAAEPDFRAARDLNNKEPENWMGLGLSLALQNKIYEAIGVYEDLLFMAPAHVPAHIQLGHLYFKVGVIAKGRDCFKRALGLRPTLDQRQAIERIMKEQDKLDQNRYYRPDFDRLAKQGTPLAAWVKNAFSFFKKKDDGVRWIAASKG